MAMYPLSHGPIPYRAMVYCGIVDDLRRNFPKASVNCDEKNHSISINGPEGDTTNIQLQALTMRTVSWFQKRQYSIFVKIYYVFWLVSTGYILLFYVFFALCSYLFHLIWLTAVNTLNHIYIYYISDIYMYKYDMHITFTYLVIHLFTSYSLQHVILFVTDRPTYDRIMWPAYLMN